MLAGLTRLLAACAIAAIAGCQNPGAPGPAPSASPSAPAPSATPSGLLSGLAPLDAPSAFGAITAIDAEVGVPQVIYQTGVEDPSKKAYGTADAHFVTVGGTRYAVAPDSWATVAKLAVGATVNLYPSVDATIFKQADGTTISTRLMDVYPGSHEEPPLVLGSLNTAH